MYYQSQIIICKNNDDPSIENIEFQGQIIPVKYIDCCCNYNIKTFSCPNNIIVYYGNNATYDKNNGLINDYRADILFFHFYLEIDVYKVELIKAKDEEFSLKQNTSIKINIDPSINSLENFFNKDYDKNMDSIIPADFSDFDSSNIVSVGNLFAGSSLKSVNLSNFGSEKLTNMKGMFKDCNELESIDFTNFNSAKVISMESMFENCVSLESFDLSVLDISSLTDIKSLFAGCSKLKTIDFSGLDMSNIKTVSNMFFNLTNLEYILLSDTILSEEIFSEMKDKLADKGILFSCQVSDISQNEENQYICCNTSGADSNSENKCLECTDNKIIFERKISGLNTKDDITCQNKNMNKYYLIKNEEIAHYKKCEDTIDNCDECSAEDHCIKCKENFGIIDNNYTKCQNISEDKDYLMLCSSLIKDCKRCNDSETCYECQEGYGLIENNTCVNITILEENKNYYKDEKIKKYISCSIIPNCITCDSGTVCTSCQEGFILKNNNINESNPSIGCIEQCSLVTNLGNKTCSDFEVSGEDKACIKNEDSSDTNSYPCKEEYLCNKSRSGDTDEECMNYIVINEGYICLKNTEDNGETNYPCIETKTCNLITPDENRGLSDSDCNKYPISKENKDTHICIKNPEINGCYEKMLCEKVQSQNDKEEIECSYYPVKIENTLTHSCIKNINGETPCKEELKSIASSLPLEQFETEFSISSIPKQKLIISTEFDQIKPIDLKPTSLINDEKGLITIPSVDTNIAKTTSIIDDKILKSTNFSSSTEYIKTKTSIINNTENNIIITSLTYEKTINPIDLKTTSLIKDENGLTTIPLVNTNIAKTISTIDDKIIESTNFPSSTSMIRNNSIPSTIIKNTEYSFGTIVSSTSHDLNTTSFAINTSTEQTYPSTTHLSMTLTSIISTITNNHIPTTIVEKNHINETILIFLGFSHFQRKPSLISFHIHYVPLKGIIFSKFLIFPLTILYDTFMRHLDNYYSNCTLDETSKENLVNYLCEVQTITSNIKQIILKPDFVFLSQENVTILGTSPIAKMFMNNIQNIDEKLNNISNSNIYVLDNCTVYRYETYFFKIYGTMNEPQPNLKNKDLILKINSYSEEDTRVRDANCNVTEIIKNNYTLECKISENTDYDLQSSISFIEDGILLINFNTQINGNISVIKKINETNASFSKYFSKKSKGLKAGSILTIVLSILAVIVIITLISIYYMRKKPKSVVASDSTIFKLNHNIV